MAIPQPAAAAEHRHGKAPGLEQALVRERGDLRVVEHGAADTRGDEAGVVGALLHAGGAADTRRHVPRAPARQPHLAPPGVQHRRHVQQQLLGDPGGIEGAAQRLADRPQRLDLPQAAALGEASLLELLAHEPGRQDEARRQPQRVLRLAAAVDLEPELVTPARERVPARGPGRLANGRQARHPAAQ
jgi:hypothetical protein